MMRKAKVCLYVPCNEKQRGNKVCAPNSQKSRCADVHGFLFAPQQLVSAHFDAIEVGPLTLWPGIVFCAAIVASWNCVWANLDAA